jgi:hypothetical protein
MGRSAADLSRHSRPVGLSERETYVNRLHFKTSTANSPATTGSDSSAPTGCHAPVVI